MNNFNSMFGNAGSSNPTRSMRGAFQSGRRGDDIPKGYNRGQLQQFVPKQLQQFKKLFSLLGKDSDLFGLASGDEDAFADIEAPAMRQFNELQGGLASRFSGLGMGGRRSSGFQNTSNAAASNFAQDLAAQRQGITRNATRDLFDLSNVLMNQRPYQRFLDQKPEKQQKSSGWGGLIGAGVGGVGGFFAGGPMGAMAGASLGSKIGSGF